MPSNKFEKLSEGIKPLPCLKRMNLSSSKYLKEIPDLSEATRLEILDLHYCRSLLELTSSIGNATKLGFCILRDCYLLKELPSSIGRLINLEELDVHSCRNLEKISGCSSLKELDLSDSGIGALEFPSSISTWSCFYRLNMSGLRDLKKFPNVPYSIVELVLCYTGIEEIPPWIENLFRLQKLIMYGCTKLEIISPNISKLENVQTIELCKGDKRIGVDHEDGYFEAVLEWGCDLKRSWNLHSDLNVHYILPTCLPEKALASPTSLRLISHSLKTIPDFIRRLSGLTELKITDCRKLTALPQLPGSLLSLDAHNCESLKRIDYSFQNPDICLNFAYCYKLNQKARKLIQTSACKYALLPGKEVHTHFTHRASSSSLTISLTPRPLPSSVRFKACILLSKIIHPEDSKLNVPEKVSCHVKGQQSGHTVLYGSNQHHHMPDQGPYRSRLYIFEDSFSVNQDCPEAEDATFSELSFLFTVDDKALVVDGCGVRILEVLDGKETEYEESISINIKENNENADDNDGECWNWVSPRSEILTQA